VTLKEGAFGLQTATTSAYQQIVIPMGLFAVSGTANQLVVQVAGSGTALGFYLDAITLQTGVAPQSGVMRGLVFNFDGGGAALTPGKTLYLRPPFACTISDLSIMSTTAETVTLKFWLVSGGTAIPTAANSINSSGVSLSTGTAMRTTVLTDFTTTAVPQDAWMAATLTAVTASQNVSATLGCRQ
jgi:hypothetical protein